MQNIELRMVRIVDMILFLLTEEFTQESKNMYTDVLVLCVENADGKCKDK